MSTKARMGKDPSGAFQSCHARGKEQGLKSLARLVTRLLQVMSLGLGFLVKSRLLTFDSRVLSTCIFTFRFHGLHASSPHCAILLHHTPYTALSQLPEIACARAPYSTIHTPQTQHQSNNSICHSNLDEDGLSLVLGRALEAETSNRSKDHVECRWPRQKRPSE